MKNKMCPKLVGFGSYEYLLTKDSKTAQFYFDSLNYYYYYI